MSETNKVLVSVVMGSKSDWEVIRAADEMLGKFGVSHQEKGSTLNYQDQEKGSLLN